MFYCIIIILDSCDCDEFGLPLAKRINKMNIEHTKQESKPSAPVNGHSNQAAVGEFSSKYPFPSDSPYYKNNELLSKLYSERVTRNPHLKHDPC